MSQSIDWDVGLPIREVCHRTKSCDTAEFYMGRLSDIDFKKGIRAVWMRMFLTRFMR